MSDTRKSPLPEGHAEIVDYAAKKLMESAELQRQQHKIIEIVAELLRYGANKKEAAKYIAALSSIVGCPQQQFDTFIAAFECMISVYFQNQKLHDQLKEQGVAVQQSSFAADAKKPVAVQQSSFATVAKISLPPQPKKSPSPVQQMPDSSKLVIGSWAAEAEAAAADSKSDVSSKHGSVDHEDFQVVNKELPYSNGEVCNLFIGWLVREYCTTFYDNSKSFCSNCNGHHLTTSTERQTASAINTLSPWFTKFSGFPLRFAEDKPAMFVHYVCGLFYSYKSIMCSKCNTHPAFAVKPNGREFFVIFNRCLECSNEGGKHKVIRNAIMNMAKEFKASGDIAAEIDVHQIVGSFTSTLPEFPKRI